MRSLILLGLGLLFGAKAQCPPDFFTIENSCVQQCPPGYMTVGTACQRCRLTFNGICVDSCPPRTTQMGDQCVPGCGSMFILPDGNCVTSCPTGTFASGQQCVPGCAPGAFMLATSGSCVDRCPDGTMPSGTMCIPSCPIGTIPMKGGCVSPAEMCDSVIAGSVFMGSTCKCPDTKWMTRATNGTTMGTCAVAPADATSPLDCPSFVAGSVFDRQIQSCTCGENAPSIVANKADKDYPFRCSDIGPAIVSCNSTARFDLMEQECKLISGVADFTPRPSIPALPSFTPRPSFPSASSLPSISVKPADSPRPSPSAKPTQRTDIIWKPSASRPPLPSLRPLFTALRPTPMPTPWRPSKPLLDVVERPPYIESSIRFAGADETQITRPEKLQDLQASLACSLRLPVENIRIQNITLTRADGSRRTIRPDFMPLSSNGSSTQCFTVARPGLRRLQQATGASTSVEYYIVEPTVEILSLTPEEFSTIVGGSSGVAAVATSVGATGVVATSEATSSQMAAPSEQRSLVGVIVGPIAAVAVIAMVGAGVATVIQRRKRSRLVRPVAQSTVIHPNPIQASGSARIVFTPSITRTGV